MKETRMRALLCSFGCGEKGRFTLLNGKNSCAQSVNSCPEMRRKNGAPKKGVDSWAGKPHPRGMAGKKSWNRGLSNETDARVAAGSRKNSEFRQKNPLVGWTKHSKHTPETINRIRSRLKEVGGGYRKGSGYGQKGRYKGIWCDSSWELALLLLWCEAKKHRIKRVTETFPYEWEGTERKYLPDFKVKMGRNPWRYTEVKGWKSAQWEEKQKAFPHDLLVIDKKLMNEEVFPLIHALHGKNFIELYE